MDVLFDLSQTSYKFVCKIPHHSLTGGYVYAVFISTIALCPHSFHLGHGIVAVFFPGLSPAMVVKLVPSKDSESHLVWNFSHCRATLAEKGWGGGSKQSVIQQTKTWSVELEGCIWGCRLQSREAPILVSRSLNSGQPLQRPVLLLQVYQPHLVKRCHTQASSQKGIRPLHIPVQSPVTIRTWWWGQGHKI